MIGLLDVYTQRFKIIMALQLQYRASVIIWLVGSMFEPIIYLVVWTTVAQSNNGQAGGYQTGDLAAYYIILLVVNHFTQIWHIWEFDRAIRLGMFSSRLLQPLHPIHYDVARNLSYKIVGLGGVVPAVIVLAVVFRPAFASPIWSILAFVPILLLAAALNFLLGWIMAMVAFWTTRSFALNHTYFAMMFFFSGQIAPLALLPSSLRTLADFLPFRWIIAFPIEVMLGRMSGWKALTGMGAQIVWLVISGLVVSIFWRAALRRYSAMGG